MPAKLLLGSTFARATSIRQKLALILVATVGVALIIAAAAMLIVEMRAEWQAAHSDLTTQAEVVGLASEAALSFGDRRVAEQNLRVLQAQPQVIAAALYDAQGRLFASLRTKEDRQAEVPPRAPPLGVRFGWRLASVARPVISNNETIGTVFIQERHGVVAQVAEYMAWLGAIMCASLFGALLLAHRLQRDLAEPIEDVSRVARAVLEQGAFDVRATRRSDDEVGQLVDAFNAMLEELGQRAQVLQEANAALSASEARYQLAARGSSAGLWDWDMRADTMFVSPRLRAALGYDETELPDRPDTLMQVMHLQDRPGVRAALDAHLQHDLPFQAECRLQQKNGGWRWFLITGMALRDEQGQPWRMAGSLIDISERKQSEILLQESNRAKDEFLATLAHELRNPLAPLRTGLQILKRPQAPPATVQRTLETMDRQLTHMVRLIDDLLDISRINSGKIRLELGAVSLRNALQAAVELARPALEAAGHALSVQWPEPDITLQGDETRLAQAFGNLLNNAAKYTPAGGQVRLAGRREGEDAVIEVQDNGIGIPADMLENVFSLFTQVDTGARQASGLGIGLFLVRTLVEMHGGSVHAHSAGTNQGSTFTVRLPCAAPAQLPLRADAGAPGTPAEASGAPVRVLVVDDNVDAAETMATFLQMVDMETRCVHDGPPAVGAALDFRPDVVLLDIGLPTMDGYQVARALRAQPALAGMALVALTGWGAEQDRRRAEQAGFDRHLTKPVDLGQLEAVVRELSARAAHPGA